MTTMNIRVDKIEANAWNPNQMDPALYENLKAHMIAEGSLSVDPLIVTPKNIYACDPEQPSDVYVLVDGEHRWKASLEIGWEDIRCDVQNLHEGEAKSISYKRNKMRGTIDPYKEAELFKSMQTVLRTQQAVANFFGVTRLLVTKRLAMLKTSDGVREVYEDQSVPRGTLTISHVETVSAIKDVGARKDLVEKIVDYRWSVRDTEERVKGVKQDLERKEILRKHVEAGDFKVCPECAADPRGESYHGFPWVNCPTGGCSRSAWNLETGATYPPMKKAESDLTEEEKTLRSEAARERSKPKSFRYPVTKDVIRGKLAKLIIKAVSGYVDLNRVNISGVDAEGKEIHFDMSSDDGVTMSFHKNVYDPRPDPGDDEDEHDFYDAGRWTRKNEGESIYFNIEPKEWKRDKKNLVKVNVNSSDPEQLQKVRDFLDGL